MLSAQVPFLLLQTSAPDGSLRWLIVGGAGLLVIYVLMRPRKKKDPLIPSSPRLSLAQQKSVERQMESLLVEFSQMARQMSAQLDNRATKLELLLKEADEKLAALRAAIDAAPPGVGIAVPPAQPGSPAVETDRDPEPEAQAPLPKIPSPHSDVYGLSDQGHSPQDIARELGRARGEIELILALRPKGEMVARTAKPE